MKETINNILKELEEQLEWQHKLTEMYIKNKDEAAEYASYMAIYCWTKAIYVTKKHAEKMVLEYVK